MKLSTNLKSLTAALVLAVPAMAPTTASAELGYNAAVSSMYLWRGQDASNGPAVSGGIDYSHESGAYASTWVSSGVAASAPGSAGGYEADFWVGYAGEAGDISYDVSYWFIEYPQETPAADVINEAAVSVGFKDFSLGLVSGDGYTYTTLGYGIDKVSLTYGIGSSDTAGADFTHLDVGYAASEAVSFTISFPKPDGNEANSLIAMTYSLPIGK